MGKIGESLREALDSGSPDKLREWIAGPGGYAPRGEEAQAVLEWACFKPIRYFSGS